MPEIKQTPVANEPASNGAGSHSNDANQSTPKERPVAPSVAPRARYAHIVGWGRHVPEKVITNHDLAQIVDTSDEWIRSRTGIAERHVAADPKETSASLAVIAARRALEVADVPASKVDLIICATTTPEYAFPATACLIQDALGASNAGAFDLSAACSGFVYALAMARGQIMAGDAEYVLVIGTETLSRIVDWTDRETCILFGDGAGAVLVAASEVPGGILAVDLGSDGSGGNTLIVPAGGSAMSTSLETVSSGMHYLKMDGKAVFRFATRVMAASTRKVLERAGYTTDEVDLVVPHQANIRIIQNSVLNQLKIPAEKVFVNLEKYGNTSTASIPIALCEAIEAGKLKPGYKVVFVGFGAGLTWAACAIDWRTPVEKQAAGWWKNTRRQATYSAAAARSMWKRAVRWVYEVLPDPETPGREPSKETPEAPVKELAGERTKE
ncbi:MAG TPA: ketoacyl-ACP synthase III [Chloroflexi bacterium]|nr:ketoacyl-ACP synthase III [Chloroflexota bacterium]HHW87039.1 ketoacyl-ACP synthase III [Chloroflexota bacterium]